MEYNPELIGHRIKQAREEKGLTLRNLGDMIGVSNATISRYENGEIAKIKMPMLQTISQLLEVNEEWLLGISDDQQPLDKSGTHSYDLITDTFNKYFNKEFGETEYSLDIPIAFMGKYAGRKDIVVIQVQDESVNKVIKKGAFAIVLTQFKLSTVKNGEMIVINHKRGMQIVEFYDLPHEVLFKPNSTDLTIEEIRIEKGPNKYMHIIGKVVGYNVILD